MINRCRLKRLSGKRGEHMRKKALAKDFRMEIKNSLNRFLSIFFIVALGVSFFAGVRASEPDMRYSGDAYFDEHQLMDLKVLSTLGITENDIRELGSLEGVEIVEPGYMADVLSLMGDSERIIHVESLPETMNKVDMVEGRLPENPEECVIDADAAKSHDIEIGDILTFKSGTDKDLEDTLASDQYEVVGTCTSPVYISFDRGSTNIGNGEIDMFAYVQEESFTQEVYTQAWVRVLGAEEAVAFTEAYKNMVDAVKERVESISDVQCDIRYAEIMDKANGEIEEAESELDKARDEAESELAEAEQKLIDGEKELEDGKAELASSEKKLVDGKNELIASRSTLDSGWSQYNSGMQEMASGKEQLTQASALLSENEAQIIQGESAIAAAEKEIADNEAKLIEGEAAIAAAEKEIAENEAAISAGEEALKAAEDEITAKEQELIPLEQALQEAKEKVAALDEGWQQYESALANLDVMKQQLSELEQLIGEGTATEEQMAEAEQLRSTITQTERELAVQRIQLEAMEAMRPAAEAIIEKEGEIVSGREQIEAGKAEIASQRAALEEGRRQLEAGKAEIVSQRAALEEGRRQLEAGRAEIASQRAALEEGRHQLEAGKSELEKQRQALAEGEAVLQASYLQLMDGERAYKSGWAQIADAEAQIAEAYSLIRENEQKLSDGWKEYEDGKKEAQEKIEDAEVKIQDAKDEIADIEKPVWYIYDRDDNKDYSGYSDNADRMGAIGKVFPILFFLVAALVSLTTMTRMVEEQRMQIGTLKALGYSKFSIAGKYIGYALLATLGGSVVGILIGQKIFPYIIVTSYKIIYFHIPDVVIPYNIGYAVMAAVAAVACTMLATVSACHRALMAQPANLMRPEAPQGGKRILLERIPWIWRNLNFTWKSTFRNLLRYKKRFFMTVFGIGGCMALMLVGYGLKDSIMDVARLQFRKIQTYDLMAIIDEDISPSEKAALDGQLEKDSRISDYMDGYMRLTEMKAGDSKKDVYLYVPSELDKMDAFVTFNHRTTGETWQMDENSVILTEKAAKDMNISVGDEVELKLEDNQTVTVQITDICENYLSHYLYMSPQMYQSLLGKEIEYNCIFASVTEEAEDQINAIGEEFLKSDSVLTVSYTNNMESDLEDMLGVLDSVIIVLIVSAGMLAFVVLYNLNNININERKRELATLKVLGFYDMEVGAYVYRENILLTIIGAGVGVVLGKVLHLFVVETVEVEQTMFGRNITLNSYLLAIAFTILFSVIVNGVMYFKLKKIDMVESLKSVE